MKDAAEKVLRSASKRVQVHVKGDLKGRRLKGGIARSGVNKARAIRDARQKEKE
jgi:hypothetical protein